MENETFPLMRMLTREKECLQHFMRQTTRQRNSSSERGEIAQRRKQENQFNVIYIFFVLPFRVGARGSAEISRESV